MTISLRLDPQTAKRLETLAKAYGVSKSELIRRCLDEYLRDAENGPTVWEAGGHYFGRHGSGHSDRSERCEEILREKFRAKTDRH